MANNLPILCLDFDGVINPYSKGWQNGELYETTVTPGFFDWAQKAKEKFRLVVYSSRSKDPMQLSAMRAWLAERWFQWAPDTINDEDTLKPTDFTFAHEKPPAFLTIDDRAMQFRGDWNATWLDPESLRDFKPWNQT